MRKLTLSICLVSSIGLLASMSGCKDPVSNADNFDKGVMLTNLADNMILPALNDFDTKIDQLEADYIAFAANRDAANLETLRNSWKQAYISWQAIKIFDFGPVRDYGFKGSTGTYPTDTAKIEANIQAGSYNLGSVNNADAIGLPALDFLLYRDNALTYFVGNDPYTTYGLNVVQKVRSELDLVVNGWSSFRTTFVSATGTETTSAFSELVNEFNRDYELAKAAKVGIPIGTQSLGIPLPEYTEARYSGISFELLRASLIALSKTYHGNSFSSNSAGVGFDDYLESLGREELSSIITNNFSGIIAKIDSFSGTLEENITTNPGDLDALYTLLQGQVVYLKTDMTSAFGVLITYQDNDGD